MSRVQWDEPAGTATPIHVRRPNGIAHFFFHGPVRPVRVHWHPAFNRTVPCVADCPHCADGLPPRREGFAPVSVWLPAGNGADGGAPIWHRLILELAPTLCDRLAAHGDLTGRVFTISTERDGAFRRYQVRHASQFKSSELPAVDPFDVRSHVESHWGLVANPGDTAAVAGDEASPCTIPFRAAAVG